MCGLSAPLAKCDAHLLASLGPNATSEAELFRRPRQRRLLVHTV